MGSAADYLKGMAEAKVTTYGVYLEPGEYTLEITDLKIIPTQDKGPAFIADFKVLASTNEAHPVGSDRNYYVKLQGNSAKGNILGLALALCGESPDTEDKAKKEKAEKVMTKAVEPNTAGENLAGLAGRKVFCRVVQITTKKEQKQFNRHDFSPIAS